MNPRQHRRTPLQLIDARRHSVAEKSLEEIRAVAGDQAIVARPQRVGQADKPRREVLQRALVEPAAAMRRRDVNNPAHFRPRLEDQSAAEEIAILRESHELLERPVADHAPEPRSAGHDHHLDQEPAHAVADQDHARTRGRSVRDQRSAAPPPGSAGTSTLSKESGLPWNSRTSRTDSDRPARCRRSRRQSWCATTTGSTTARAQTRREPCRGRRDATGIDRSIHNGAGQSPRRAGPRDALAASPWKPVTQAGLVPARDGCAGAITTSVATKRASCMLMKSPPHKDRSYPPFRGCGRIRARRRTIAGDALRPHKLPSGLRSADRRRPRCRR